MKFSIRVILVLLYLFILASMSVYAETITLGGIPIDDTMVLIPANGKYSITYREQDPTELTSGQNVVMLVVKGIYATPTSLSISTDSIRYIDQIASNDTSITFENFIPSSVPNCTILLGGLANSTEPKIIGYIEAEKVTVTGTMVISGKTAATARLINSFNTEYSISSSLPTSVSQTVTFSIPTVPIDTYKFIATKPGCLSFSINSVDVNEFGASITGVSLLGGDINQNENINVYDLADLLADYGKKTTTAVNVLSDINENGDINVYDLAELLMNYGKSATIN